MRFLVHEGDFEQAWHLVRNAPSSDPWLLASRIAAADLAGKPIGSVREANRLLETLPSIQTSELAASLATIDLASGGLKRAKKLFRASAEAPTDNAVAQIRWADEKVSLGFDHSILETELSFEARTGQFLFDKKWNSALEQSVGWLADEPFSLRAAGTGCYIASELVQDYERCEIMATLGFIAHPHDPGMLNNRAFARACLGKIEGALADLAAARELNVDPEQAMLLNATEGCILYRSGQPDAGGAKYREAVEKGVELKSIDNAQRALVHWIHEEGRAGRSFDPETKTVLEGLFKGKKVSKPVKDVFDVYAEPFFKPGQMELIRVQLDGLVRRLTDMVH